MITYTPEVGMNLAMLLKDVETLKNRYKLDEQGKSEGRIILKYARVSFLYFPFCVLTLSTNLYLSLGLMTSFVVGL